MNIVNNGFHLILLSDLSIENRFRYFHEIVQKILNATRQHAICKNHKSCLPTFGVTFH